MRCEYSGRYEGLPTATYKHYVDMMCLARKFLTAVVFIFIKNVFLGFYVFLLLLIELLQIKATVEYQKEVIRQLKENLRRNQQAQDTSSKWKMLILPDLSTLKHFEEYIMTIKNKPKLITDLEKLFFR